ncbi:Protein-L-isoaspartate(D-aspartate) O-methyltransferase (PCMT) [Actinacidiphila alni]|uniref:Protein-L-isoaspartate O-methyltransferase n=2 Tax=Actinacidiphila alni TaxID=380248 RepID=A0A1I2KEC6_9ACTN|nr:Protein-L-isoaspartate(D-aspartate) O-methyltransferase (PCMT) [Actinacidiphila alni]
MLCRSLLKSGALAADWAPVFAAVPRSGFLPEVMWPFDVGAQASTVADRSADPGRWHGYAEADVPVVTQWDDGRHAGPGPGKVATSSASMPSVVAAMLADLDVRDGQAVLEIGTGTGWNAGLLAHRLGGARVTTVEVDAAVAEAARDALRRAGLGPTVVTGDGRDGYRPGAPYDRVIATCGVREIPYAWVEQTALGGIVVAPWGTPYGNGDAVVRLVVADGTASGRFTRLVEFMKLRAHRGPAVRHGDVVPYGGVEAAEESTTGVTEAEFLTGRYTALPFVLGLRVPGCVQAAAGKRGGARPVWFYGRDGRGEASWAVVMFRDGRPTATVRQGGPRRLWDEVEAAYHWWAERGRPGVGRFGLTVDGDGQYAWLDDPAGAWPVDGAR